MKVRKEHVEFELAEGHPCNGGDGHWLYLKPGFKNSLDTPGVSHIIHEDTKTECYKQDIEKCDCDDCSDSI